LGDDTGGRDAGVKNEVSGGGGVATLSGRERERERERERARGKNEERVCGGAITLWGGVAGAGDCRKSVCEEREVGVKMSNGSEVSRSTWTGGGGGVGGRVGGRGEGERGEGERREGLSSWRQSEAERVLQNEKEKNEKTEKHENGNRALEKEVRELREALARAERAGAPNLLALLVQMYKY
jgi:hypothetical protein